MLFGKKTAALVPGLLVALLLVPALWSCAPRQVGATRDSLYAAGRADFTVRVAPPLTLAGTGVFNSSVPSDVNIGPWGRFRYAVFTDADSGPVSRHAHAALCEFNQLKWKWEKETWALPEAFYYSKERRGGKYWTVQMLPVAAQGDWYSALWRENGRETPEFWIAKRWSSTPEDDIRLVAEYREPAPECMAERLREAAARPMGAPPLKGGTLVRNCDEAIAAFSQRADAVFSLDAMNRAAPDGTAAPGQGDGQLLTARPKKGPNMLKLMGRAELVDRGGDVFRP